MEKKDKDRLLANFIGSVTGSSIRNHPDHYQYNFPFCDGYYPSLDTMKFDKSWDWLIPVYEKWNDEFIKAKYTPDDYHNRGITLNILQSYILENNIERFYEIIIDQVKRLKNGKDTAI